MKVIGNLIRLWNWQEITALLTTLTGVNLVLCIVLRPFISLLSSPTKSGTSTRKSLFCCANWKNMIDIWLKLESNKFPFKVKFTGNDIYDLKKEVILELAPKLNSFAAVGRHWNIIVHRKSIIS